MMEKQAQAEFDKLGCWVQKTEESIADGDVFRFK